MVHFRLLKVCLLGTAISVQSLFCLAENSNEFYLDEKITNVQRTELFTYFGMPNSTLITRPKQVLVNLSYAVEYDEDKIKDLWIISEPVFDNSERKLPNGTVIPSGFFKIIVRQTSYKESSVQAISVYFPHVRTPEVVNFQLVTVDWLEDKTHLDFMPNLPDDIETMVESTGRSLVWEKL
ncbi:hypothetical protein OAG1_17760 [Agarivorans sp. OAG1]|uniref:DNA/RNA non-specific endonuclease n=1 Tax=Agarivorans sp. OAG1 TaxID=3082387 RepID=UPI002B2FFEF5|nr:hypothetical protein OAG1_17760 [Agarivorans sp. OAG1]